MAPNRSGQRKQKGERNVPEKEKRRQKEMKFLDNLFKKPEKDRKAAYKPSSSQTKAVEAKGGGKGSARDIEFSKGGPSKDQRKRILASQNDNSFGYYDMNSGKYIPAFVDMFDGGGRNTSGDTFQGAGLYSAALNAAGVAPYGYNRPRTYAQAGMENRPALPAPSPTPEPPTNYQNMRSGMNASNSYVPTIPAQPQVTRRELGPSDAYMGVGVMPNQMMGGYDTVPESLPNAGFYQAPPSMLGAPPQSTDLAAMMEMLRREMEAKELRSALPPTLLGQ